MTRLHKNACFRFNFLHLFDVNDQNKSFTVRGRSQMTSSAEGEGVFKL